MTAPTSLQVVDDLVGVLGPAAQAPQLGAVVAPGAGGGAGADRTGPAHQHELLVLAGAPLARSLHACRQYRAWRTLGLDRRQPPWRWTAEEAP